MFIILLPFIITFIVIANTIKIIITKITTRVISFNMYTFNTFWDVYNRFYCYETVYNLYNYMASMLWTL